MTTNEQEAMSNRYLPLEATPPRRARMPLAVRVLAYTAVLALLLALTHEGR